MSSASQHLHAHNQDDHHIRQAIIDLIHTYGYHDPTTLQFLKSGTRPLVLKGFEEILEQRDSFAKAMGFQDGFSQVLEDLRVSTPTGAVSPLGMEAELKRLASENVNKSQKSVYHIRHLSMTESPFRSCLGQDCSSAVYLTKALDPNYHYFTVTDSVGFSNGHVTVVLGRASNVNRDRELIAFIDKIQNIQLSLIPNVLEAVRKSVKERGYLLALPLELGDSGGLTIQHVIRDFIAKKYQPKGPLHLDFEPHSSMRSKYFPYHPYTRANNKPAVFLVPPLEEATSTISALPGELSGPRRLEHLNLKPYLQQVYALKNGGPKNKIRYIPTNLAIQNSGFEVDPEFDYVLKTWLRDKSQLFSLRKKVLIHLWNHQDFSIPELLEEFIVKERAIIFENLMAIDDYRDKILNNEEGVARLLIALQGSSTSIELLMNSIEPGLSKLVIDLLSQASLPTETLELYLKALFENFNSLNTKRIFNSFEVSQDLWGTPQLAESFAEAFLNVSDNDSVIGKSILNCLMSNNKKFIEFCRKITTSNSSNRFPSLAALGELLNRYQIEKSFLSSLLKWLESQDASSRAKADLLILCVGNPTMDFDDLLSRVPSVQINDFWNRINSRSSLGTFLSLATSNEIRDFILREGSPESFVFEKHSLQNGSRPTAINPSENMQIGAAPVSQLQYALVMGVNPSKRLYKPKAIRVTKKLTISWLAHRTEVLIDPNQPVSNLTRKEVIRFTNRLNNISDSHIYDHQMIGSQQSVRPGKRSPQHKFKLIRQRK